MRGSASRRGLQSLFDPRVAGNLLEVGVVGSADGPIFVHAMPARPKYLR